MTVGIVEVGTIASVILRKGLTEENIEKAADIISNTFGKIGSKLSAYLEERKKRSEASKADMKTSEIPTEVKEEVTVSLKEVLKSIARPVYMDGIAFFCDEPMNKETQGLLEKILTNIDEGFTWEDDQKNEYQSVIDNFMEDNYGGCSPDKYEDEYWIDDDVFYLNFTLHDITDYPNFCNDEAIRSLVDAINHLLGNKYITGYTPY